MLEQVVRLERGERTAWPRGVPAEFLVVTAVAAVVSQNVLVC